MTATRRTEAARGSRILHRNAVRIHTDPIPVGEQTAEGDAVAVELVRDGAVIRQIRLTCPCGQAIVLDCRYPGEADAS